MVETAKDQCWKWHALTTLKKKSEDDVGFKVVVRYVYRERSSYILHLSNLTALAPSTVLAHCHSLRNLGIVELDPVMGHDPFQSYFKLANKGLALETLVRELDLL